MFDQIVQKDNNLINGPILRRFFIRKGVNPGLESIYNGLIGYIKFY